MVLDRFRSPQGQAELIANKILSIEDDISQLTQQEMREQLKHFQSNIQNNSATLDDYLVQVFAMVREASCRVTGKKHYKSQLMGGYVLHKGSIAEMKTGEGKTLVAGLPAVLNALTKKQIFVITVNDYLAKRDSEILKPIYEYLGFSVGYVVAQCNQEKKRQAYNADIIYITNNEICFDFLRDNMGNGNKLQKDHYYAIIDEVDNILIDESRTPLIISGPENKVNNYYEKINSIIANLSPNHYTVEQKSKNAYLNNSGFETVEQKLMEMGFIKEAKDLYGKNIDIYHVVQNLVKSHYGMVVNRDYVVSRNEIIIVDEFTGRLTPGRKFSNGLHQALEAKEKVKVTKGSITNASITYTNFFRMFEKLSGMTGTASEADEFSEIYNLKVVKIPTNKPIIRKDNKILELYHKKEHMWREAVKIIKEKHEKGQPLLICTPSVYESESFSNYLDEENIKYNLLNARSHEQEAEIVSQAGRFKAITIATNMAGRGTDIMLGGCTASALKLMMKQNPDFTDIEAYTKELGETFKKDREKVLRAGGLFVLVLGALDSEKSMMQFIGRSGRQGEPGESKCMASLEDDIMINLHKDGFNQLLIKVYFPDYCNTNAKAQSLVQEIQNTYQSYFFEIRKNTLKYDNVVNEQRKEVYGYRDFLLAHQNPKSVLEKVLKAGLKQFKEEGSITKLEFLPENICSYTDLEQDLKEKVNDLDNRTIIQNMLGVFDDNWYKLINIIEDLKKTIHLVAFSQRDSFFAFKEEAFKFFKEMITEYPKDMIRFFYKESDLLNFDFNNLLNEMQNTENDSLETPVASIENLMKNLKDQDTQNIMNSMMKDIDMNNLDMKKMMQQMMGDSQMKKMMEDMGKIMGDVNPNDLGDLFEKEKKHLINNLNKKKPKNKKNKKK